jgi:glycerol transport system ATP-binding protein
MAPGRAPEGAATLGVRPEHVALVPQGTPGALPAEVTQVQDIGTYWLVHAKVGDHVIRARLGNDAVVPKKGDTVSLRVLGPHTCFYASNEELVEAA